MFDLPEVKPLKYVRYLLYLIYLVCDRIDRVVPITQLKKAGRVQAVQGGWLTGALRNLMLGSFNAEVKQSRAVPLADVVNGVGLKASRQTFKMSVASVV